MTTTNGSGPPAGTSAPAPETTVGRMEGVRPCLQCGHDLHGQSILRESTYGLLIARCPECGTVAALVEHPRLGIWGRRLGAVVMSTMLALAIPLLLLTSLALFGVAAGIFDEQIRAGREVLNALVGDVNMVTPEWWATNGAETRRSVLRAVFSWQRDTKTMLAVLSPVPVLLGILWSALLLGVPRRWLWLAAVVAGLIAGVFVWFGTIDDKQLGVDPVFAWQAAFQIGIWPVTSLVLLVETLLMAAGLTVGRPLLRWLAVFMLPPRPRRTLSLLWTVDGLEPPRGRS